MLFVQGGRIRRKFLLTVPQCNRVCMRANLHLLGITQQPFPSYKDKMHPSHSMTHLEFYLLWSLTKTMVIFDISLFFLISSMKNFMYFKV